MIVVVSTILETGRNLILYLKIIDFMKSGSKRLDENTFRRILIKAFKANQPDFRFLTYATGVFYFQRVRDFYDLDLNELVHIVYNFEKKTMHCSVSSRLNPVYIMSPVYSNSLVNAHVDLIAIKRGYSIYPTEDTVYRCDGTTAGAQEMVEEMIRDVQLSGLRYLDKRLNDLWANHVVRKGIDIIDEWDFDKIMLRNELVKHLRSAKNRPQKLRHPMVNKFRDQLMTVPNISADMKQRVPMLAFDLLELYCNNRIAP
jgi:hypothetical protein